MNVVPSAAHPWPADESVIVRGDGLTAVVLPQRGGKIASLLDGDGREWLAQPEAPVGPPARPGADFLAAEMAGWDECAPTIVACDIDGAALPDHGSLWTMSAAGDGHTVTFTDDSLGFRFERTIVPASGGLRFDYVVTATRQPVPFLWAAHPQFAAPPGTRVRVPAAVATAVDVLDPALPESPWEATTGAIDDLPEGGCRKVYAHPDGPVFEAELVRPDGTLSMRWTSACPYLGVWMERGRYRHGPVIAIEPTTSYFDALDIASRRGRTPVIAPDEPLAWTLWIETTSDHA